LAKKGITKKYLRVGPGGMNCNCCAPAPGKRKQLFRSAKRREEHDAVMIEAAEWQDLVEYWERKCR